MVNELQRQTYLSALGIENYMPRMLLPFAPSPVVCELPDLTLIQETVLQGDKAMQIPPTSGVIGRPVESVNKSVMTEILSEVKAVKKPAAAISAASILEQLDVKKPLVIEPFALSLWRPVTGFLIVDSRSPGSALPTELLLNNLLRACFPGVTADLNEEVMRWPMIENRFISRTEDDARNELQTWLAVENELRPINKLWLMGDNAMRYLLSADIKIAEAYWHEHQINITGTGANSLYAFILPSLVELLQAPLLKARLWASIKQIF